MDGARARSIDLVSLCTRTPEREKFLGFSRSVISVPWVIVTRREFRDVDSLADLRDGTVAMVEGYAVVELSRIKFPGLNIQTVDSPLAGLRAVEAGEVDAYVDNLGVSSHVIRDNSLIDLRVAADAGLGVQPLHICYRSDWPELGVILNG